MHVTRESSLKIDNNTHMLISLSRFVMMPYLTFSFTLFLNSPLLIRSFSVKNLPEGNKSSMCLVCPSSLYLETPRTP